MKSITLTMEDQQLKDILKQALLELMEERQELFQQILTEVLEETNMVSAIQEGLKSEDISRDDIFQILEVSA
ncbi:MAG: hypothetical protein M5U34_43210 [Chloroflexi bacterium]|nr:hypothetical protein [Chloroflexota bacterium]